MRIEDLDYDLPADRIAQVPAARREAARLLLVDREHGSTVHAYIPDLSAELRPGDCVVANNTHVLRARLYATRDTGGAVEVFLVSPTAAPEHWLAMLRAGGRPQVGETLRVGEDVLTLVARDKPDGLWTVTANRSMFDVLETNGQMPLPPYITRERADPRAADDKERYQTVFAAHRGAVAAPTAGLHLTEALIDQWIAQGVVWAPLTLHVGLGTFQPVRTETLNEHTMHTEGYVIPDNTAQAIRTARAQGNRIVAIGTTVVRALEASALASPDGLPRAEATQTNLLIQPGHEFLAVDALLTNFHLPRSTLLALVAAFMGLDEMRAAYQTAVAAGYRFYSYGDAMFIRRCAPNA